MYQVGLTETDQHIEFFWTALESFGQDDLGRFIKFACNQERILRLVHAVMDLQIQPMFLHIP